MSYAIVGFGEIGQALAHAFARKNIDVTVASRRPPEALAPQARAIGPTVVAKSLRDALEADTIILAVPFGEHREVAALFGYCRRKTKPSTPDRRTRNQGGHFQNCSKPNAARAKINATDESTAIVQTGL